jgi:hypothetical protein
MSANRTKSILPRFVLQRQMPLKIHDIKRSSPENKLFIVSFYIFFYFSFKGLSGPPLSPSGDE